MDTSLLPRVAGTRNRIIVCFSLIAFVAILGGVFTRPFLRKKPLPGPFRQADTSLQGKAAVEYLKQQGAYERLRASIEATEYELEPAPQPGAAPTLAAGQSTEVY